MKRLFISHPFPESEAERLEKFLEPFHDDPRFKGAKWVEPKHYHFTSLFIGEVPDMVVQDIIEISRGFCSRIPIFTLEFDKIQLFPYKKPTMLWARFKPNMEMRDLFEGLVHFLQPYLPFSFAEKTPLPHITLARLKSGMNSFEMPSYKIPEQKIHESQIIESLITPAGPIYTVIEKISLAPSPLNL